MMYDREKSDPAIVAVKPTNKAGQPAAELVEPRAGAEDATGCQCSRQDGRRQAARHEDRDDADPPARASSAPTSSPTGPQEHGVFADHGLAVEQIPVASSPAQFASLMAGEYDAVLTSPDNVATYVLNEGNPLGPAAGPADPAGRRPRRPAQPGRRPGIERLGGPRRAAGSPSTSPPPGSPSSASPCSAGPASRPGRDYEVVTAGATPRRRQLLADGAFEATLLNAGHEARAVRAGAHVLGVVERRRPALPRHGARHPRRRRHPRRPRPAGRLGRRRAGGPGPGATRRRPGAARRRSPTPTPRSPSRCTRPCSTRCTACAPAARWSPRRSRRSCGCGRTRAASSRDHDLAALSRPGGGLLRS